MLFDALTKESSGMSMGGQAIRTHIAFILNIPLASNVTA